MREKILWLGEKSERLGVVLVTVIGMLIGLALTYYSAFYTELSPAERDGSMTVRDNVFLNLAVLLVVFCVAAGFCAWSRKNTEKALRAEKPVLVFTLLWALLTGLLWVCLAHVRPSADGHSVCVVAEAMLKGDYPMQPPTYMGYNPQQYGLVFVLQGMFRLFGPGNYLPWKIMNALLFPLMIYGGYRILKLTTDSVEIRVFYLLLAVGFLPDYFYLNYVYGDIPSAACGMVILWQAVSYVKTGKKSAVWWMSAAAAFGCLVRKNTWIVLIAAGVILAVEAVRHFTWKPLLALLILCIAAAGAERGVRLFYEGASGQKIHSGIPTSCYVMMGLEDSEEGPGWFNGSNYRALAGAEYDTDKAAEYGREQISIRLEEFLHRKKYALDFFRRKILTQWNMPDCYGMHETMRFDRETEKLPRLTREVYMGRLTGGVQSYMNRYQFVLYALFTAGVFGWFRQKGRGLADCALLIAVAGGMFFSILWEAMSRYVLPYVGYMIPFAAAGLYFGVEFLSRIYNKRGQVPRRREG